MNELEDAFPLHFEDRLRWGLLFRSFVVESLYNYYSLRIRLDSLKEFRKEVSRELSDVQFKKFKKRVRYGTSFDGNHKVLLDLFLKYYSFLSYHRLVRWWRRWNIFNNVGISDRFHRLLIFLAKKGLSRLKWNIWLKFDYFIRTFIFLPVNYFLYPFFLLDEFISKSFFRDTKLYLFEKNNSKHLKVLSESYRYSLDILNGLGPMRRGVFRFIVLNKKGFLSSQEKLVR